MSWTDQPGDFLGVPWGVKYFFQRGQEFSDVEGNTSVPASPGRDFRTRWRMKGAPLSHAKKGMDALETIKDVH